MADQDRIRLVKAMNRNQGPLSKMYENIINEPIFDPFTDANADYAVLEWMRNKDDFSAFADQLRHRDRIDYEKGDYARAALKVLNDE